MAKDQPDITGKGLSPLLSLAIGVAVSIVVGVITAWTALWVIQSFVPLQDLYATCIFWAVAIVLGGHVFVSGQGHVTPTGYESVITLFGSRMSWPTLSEGDGWLPPGFDHIPVDMRVDVTGKIMVSGLTKDGVRARSETALQVRSLSPYKFLSTKDPIAAITTIAESKVREVFITRTVDEVTSAEAKGAVIAAIQEAIDLHEHEIGIDVMKVFEPEIFLPEALEADRANLLREQAQRIAEKEEIDGFRVRVSELAGIKPEQIKLSQELAAEIVQTAQGKLAASKQVVRFEGLQSVADALAGSIAAALKKEIS